MLRCPSRPAWPSLPNLFWWFALAFVCIGLETRFIDLATMEGGRPAVAFIAAQIVNVFWTLLLAYLLFGGVIFPVPDIK
jgi:hypothetical protein